MHLQPILFRCPSFCNKPIQAVAQPQAALSRGRSNVITLVIAASLDRDRFQDRCCQSGSYAKDAESKAEM